MPFILFNYTTAEALKSRIKVEYVMTQHNFKSRFSYIISLIYPYILLLFPCGGSVMCKMNFSTALNLGRIDTASPHTANNTMCGKIPYKTVLLKAILYKMTSSFKCTWVLGSIASKLKRKVLTAW